MDQRVAWPTVRPIAWPIPQLIWATLWAGARATWFRSVQVRQRARPP